MAMTHPTALRLAEAGIAVFPCGPNKKPLVKWRKFSSSDADAVLRMWTKYPGALPGIDLEKSELVALDGDRHDNQPDGRTALRNLLREQPDFNYFATPMVFTPHDGAHAYFSQNGHELTNQEGNLPAGNPAHAGPCGSLPSRNGAADPGGHCQPDRDAQGQ
jgi:hypothetical protein